MLDEKYRGMTPACFLMVTIILVRERSEPLSMVFNDQPRDIYNIWPMSDRPYVSNTPTHVRMSV